MRRCLVLFAACALGLGLVAELSADEMPKEIAEAVKSIGPVINPAETAKLFAPLHKKEPYDGVLVSRDQKYGNAERNRLDVFAAHKTEGLRPVLVYVHGGGYVRGDKRLAKDSPFYDNVMLWAVANGMVGVNMTYRLAPEALWPSGSRDVALAIDWVRANISRFGGDHTRIYLMGHSAGATHVAGYLAMSDLIRSDGSGIAGAILVSGTYRLKPDADVPGQKAYFGADTAVWEARSSLTGLVASRVPLLVAHGGIDMPYYIEQAQALRDELCALQRCPRFVVLNGHSHMSEVYAVNTGDGSLVRPMLDFIFHR